MPDLILMDINLQGDMNGIEVAHILAANGQSGVIFLSAYSEAETVKQASACGAQGYLVKPFQETTLLATVEVALARRALDRTDEIALAELQSALADAQLAALTDPLTQIYNRKGMDLQVSRELERARRHSQTVALMLLDIDYFKRINDCYGHQAGDSAVKEVALRIVDSVRPTDIVARFGGDEFLVFAADNCSAVGAINLAERILHRIRNTPVLHETSAMAISATIGLATVAVTENVALAGLVSAADQALYSAKGAGRDRVVATALLPNQEAG